MLVAEIQHVKLGNIFDICTGI